MPFTEHFPTLNSLHYFIFKAAFFFFCMIFCVREGVLDQPSLKKKNSQKSTLKLQYKNKPKDNGNNHIIQLQG